jgi:hypothetical protein
VLKKADAGATPVRMGILYLATTSFSILKLMGVSARRVIEKIDEKVMSYV